MVFVGRVVPGIECDFVGVDNAAGGEMAVRHLIQKGQRRIAMLGGSHKLTSWVGRKEGYDKALREAGIESDASLVLQGPATRDCGAELVQQLLRLPDPPTAIFCYNDIIAIGAMMKLKEMGLTPGRDIAIVGFDNIPEASIFSPKLTTVSSHVRLMGKHAAALLCTRMENPDLEPRKIIVHPELIIRESCS